MLQRAKADGFTGSARMRHSGSGKETKRLNKNRPMEMSSKKPVRIYRDVIQAPKQIRVALRHLRRKQVCAIYTPFRFKKSYGFIYDENLPMERRAKGHPELIKQAKQQLAAFDRQLEAEADRRKLEEKSNEQRKKENEQVQQGKIIKKSDKRKEGLIEKFEELKKTGKLRRKNAAKDRRYMPWQLSFGFNIRV